MTVALEPINQTQWEFLRVVSNKREGPLSSLRSLPNDSSTWYLTFLGRRWKELPTPLRECLLDYSGQQGYDPVPGFFKVLTLVSEILSDSARPSLESISERLVEQKLFVDRDGVWISRKHQLVFTVIGWLTMLYSPCLDLQDEAAGILLPRDSSNEVIYTDIFTSFSNPLADLEGLPIHQMLKTFGQLIPGGSITAPNVTLLDVFSEQLVVSCLNFLTISKIAGIRVVFTENLSLHLDFDERTHLLKLFRYPSFCETICSGSLGGNESVTQHPQYLSHLFRDHFAGQSGNTLDDENSLQGLNIVDLFKEVLLSYRLIFGQHKKSQSAFRKMKYFTDSDPLLRRLCGQPWTSEPVYRHIGALPTKKQYSARKDFPFFAARLLKLQRHILEQDPNDLWTLWYDRRDILRFYTFWAVVIVGGASIVLGILQLIVGILQIWK